VVKPLSPPSITAGLAPANAKLDRLLASGFVLSRNNRKIILYGQLLTTLTAARDAENFAALVDTELTVEKLPPVSLVLGSDSWILRD
jgi:hypothetical protein